MSLWKARSSAWRLALLVVIAGVGVVRLWADAWRHPNDPWSVPVIYRALGTGDIQYFLIISQLARGIFGEAYVYEEMGRGMMSFPLTSAAPHAAFMRLFGLAGFVVADALVFASFFASLAYFLRALRVDSPWRECLAMFLVCGGQNALHKTFGTDVWSYRIPRPFVATVYLLVALTLAIRLVRSRRALGSWRTWVLLGLLLSINLQSFIYNAINVGLLLGVLALYALARGRTRRVVWGQVMSGAGLVLARRRCWSRDAPACSEASGRKADPVANGISDILCSHDRDALPDRPGQSSLGVPPFVLHPWQGVFLRLVERLNSAWLY